MAKGEQAMPGILALIFALLPFGFIAVPIFLQLHWGNPLGILCQYLALTSFVLAIASTAWAFQTCRGCWLAYIAYLVIFVVSTLFFVIALQHVSGPRGIDPMAVFLIGVFIAVVAVGLYGVASWRRKPKPATETQE
jgi:hypothetical protein